ncbi:MAG: D-alanyl-D-alanine carboxypeptidase family protein [Limnochordia bacterium]|jgi:D-alanyl-D-alanine carboxypeptidase (penicillin-binding protein 5/6)
MPPALRRLFLMITALCLCGMLVQDASREPASMVWVPIVPSLGVAYVPSAHSGPPTSAWAAIVYENTTKTVLYAKNEHTTRAPASLTKIMTALLALENGRMDDTVTVSRLAAGMWGSSAHLRSGQQIKLRDLLYGMLLPSGNDAAVAVAEHIGGSLPAFVEMMNLRAVELGARHTRFANPHGLDHPEHYSTAFDLAMLSRVALLYPNFADAVQTRTYTASESSSTWSNTNKLLWSFEGAEGIKTGTTGQAGNCLAAAASRQGMQLIVVVLSSANRWKEASRLFTYAFDNYAVITMAEKGVPLAQVRLKRGSQPLVLTPAHDICVLVPQQKTDAPLSTHLSLDKVTLPIRAGSRIGVFEVFAGQTRLAAMPLVAQGDVERLSLWRTIRERLR